MTQEKDGPDAASQAYILEKQTRRAWGKRLIDFAFGQKKIEQRLEEVKKTGQKRTA